MWLSNRLSHISRHSLVILEGKEIYGASHIIAAHKNQGQTLIWLDLEPNDVNDPQIFAHKLYNAHKQGIGHALYSPSLPVETQLNILNAHRSLLPSLTIALSNAQYSLPLVQSILTSKARKIILTFNSLPLEVDFSNALILDENQLCLNEDEALAEAANQLADHEVFHLLQANHRAIEPFRVALCKRLHLPLPLTPKANGLKLPHGHAKAVAPLDLLYILMEKGDWLKALDVAVYHLPEQVSQILEHAGPFAQAKGLFHRLWTLLEDLPETYWDETVLYWKLLTAWKKNKHENIQGNVEALLSKSEAPDLRALYAKLFLPSEQAQKEFKRALINQATPLTHYLHITHSKNVPSLYQLRHVLRSAEHQGNPQMIVRIAEILMQQLVFLGHFQEAVFWGKWILDLYAKSEIADPARQFQLINTWAHSRILTGDTTGLHSLLHENERLAILIAPEQQVFLRANLGAYYQSISNMNLALSYYQSNWETANRLTFGIRGLPYVKTLLDIGEQSKALDIAHKAFTLTQEEKDPIHVPAKLAYALALSSSHDPTAFSLLASILKSKNLPATTVAQASLYLAKMYLDREDLPRAKKIVEQAEHASTSLKLSGLRLLSGPEVHFKDLWNLMLDEPSALELRFLNQSIVWFNNEPYELSPKRKELLALLAIHPMGISAEKLRLYLYETNTTSNALYSLIAQTRKWIPIESFPYRLSIPVKADFLVFKRLIQNGQLRQALALYKGPLLPMSKAPGIVNLRQELQDSLHHNVMRSQDPDVLITYAQSRPHDLELWERTLNHLSTKDPRAWLCLEHLNELKRNYGLSMN